MIKKYKVQGKDRFVPKVWGRFLEWVPNLGIYVRTKDPRNATSLSTRDKALDVIKRYKGKL